MSFDLDKCRSKDELEAFALQMFKVDLDKRKKLDELKDEVRALMANPPLVTEPVAEAKKPETVEDSYVLNPKTGTVFFYHDLLKEKVSKNELIRCDKDGKPL